MCVCVCVCVCVPVLLLLICQLNIHFDVYLSCPSDHNNKWKDIFVFSFDIRLILRLAIKQKLPARYMRTTTDVKKR